MGDWIKREGPWLKHVSKRDRAAPIAEQTQEKQQDDDQSEQYGVIYHPIRCPKCKSKKIKTHTSRPPTRYHKCQDCGFNFKSTEKDA